MFRAASIALAIVLLVPSAASAEPSEGALFRDWIRARCIAVAAGESPLAKDAAASAGAYVERGGLPATAYEAGEALIAAALAKPASGTKPVRYDTLKCLELATSRDVARVLARSRGK